jgi:hypothetical protein
MYPRRGIQSTTMSTVLVLAPPSQALFAQYVKIAQQHEYPPPTGSMDGGIFIATAEGTLVAAVTMFRTTGTYILFEDFVINPEAPPRVRHAAAQQLGMAIASTCNEAGKVPYCPVTVKGAVMILEKMGFEGREVMLMTRAPQPTYLDTVEEIKKPPREKPLKPEKVATPKGGPKGAEPNVARKALKRR